MAGLIREAEDFLAQLDRALWSLSPAHREAVLLEMRGHFEEHMAEGRLYLLSTLERMGSPAEIARAFVEAAGHRWHSRPANDDNLPITIVQSRELRQYRAPRQRLPIPEMIETFRLTVMAARNGFWSIGALLVPALTAAGFLIGIDQLSNGAQTIPIWAVTATRSTLLALALVAAYRALLTHDDLIWNISKETGRFSAALLAMIGLGGIAYLGMLTAIRDVLQLPPGSTVTDFLSTCLGLGVAIVAFLISIRLQPWAVGLAIDDDRINLSTSWLGTSGRIRELMTGWLIFVAPLAIAHGALQILISITPYTVYIKMGLAISAIDAIVTTLLVIAIAVLNTIAFRWVVDEAIPDAAAFSTIHPTAEQVAEMRSIMKSIIDQRRMAKRFRTTPIA